MMDAIRTLIVDDEPLARDGIRGLLDEDPEIEVVGECSDGGEAARAMEELEPDLVFLDIQMPEKDGFEALEEVGTQDLPFIVFVTAYDEYAVRAFEVHALDYVLKPFDDTRFLRAVARAKQEVRHRRDSEFASRVAEMLAHRDEKAANGDGRTGTSVEGRPRAGPKGPSEDEDGHLRRMVIRRAGRVFFLDVDDIDWFEAADYYVRLHVGGDSHLVRTTMKELEASLDPGKFIRTHRSSIVRIDFIRELQPYFHGEYVVLLKDGTKLSLSRSRRKELEDKLGQRL
ncbi:MAG: LytR/AlgR family response regulator transcription factor [Gemmatimonadota bacterium]